MLVNITAGSKDFLKSIIMPQVNLEMKYCLTYMGPIRAKSVPSVRQAL